MIDFLVDEEGMSAANEPTQRGSAFLICCRVRKAANQILVAKLARQRGRTRQMRGRKVSLLPLQDTIVVIKLMCIAQ